MFLSDRFKKNWKEDFNQLQPANCRLLLAVSGGVDSVVLTDIIAKTNFNFVIAHCNFKLRQKESERDEIFVKLLGEKYKKEVIIKNFDTEQYANEKKISIQEAARNLRYSWLNEIVNEEWRGKKGEELSASIFNHSTNQPIGYPTTNYIATAHNANDTVETLLFNFCRGTGIKGVHGILLKQGKIIRPLLFAHKEEIIEYARENNLNWVEDSSNAEDKYTRNFFRLQILPAIKKVFPNIENNLLKNIERFKEVEVLYDQAIEFHKKKLVDKKGNEFHISVLKLQKTTPLDSIIFEIIKDFNFHSSQVDEVKKLFTAANAAYINSLSHRIIKNRNWLIIAPVETIESQHILIKENDKKIVFEGGTLWFEQLNNNRKPATEKNIASLDADKIMFPLLLRKWKQGDYFYPLGMQKKKKLKKFLIDEKLSKTEKEKVWVLEMNKKILWIVGFRIDDRFKLNLETQNVLKIHFEIVK